MRTNTMTRILKLKSGDPALCQQTKQLTRKCRKRQYSVPFVTHLSTQNDSCAAVDAEAHKVNFDSDFEPLWFGFKRPAQSENEVKDNGNDTDES